MTNYLVVFVVIGSFKGLAIDKIHRINYTQ